MKIKLTIAGKEVELTPEEAKVLHAELSKAFAPVSREEHHHHHYPWISPALVQPLTPAPWPAEPYRVTCGENIKQVPNGTVIFGGSPYEFQTTGLVQHVN